MASDLTQSPTSPQVAGVASTPEYTKTQPSRLQSLLEEANNELVDYRKRYPQDNRLFRLSEVIGISFEAVKNHNAVNKPKELEEHNAINKPKELEEHNAITKPVRMSCADSVLVEEYLRFYYQLKPFLEKHRNHARNIELNIARPLRQLIGLLRDMERPDLPLVSLAHQFRCHPDLDNQAIARVSAALNSFATAFHPDRRNPNNRVQVPETQSVAEDVQDGGDAVEEAAAKDPIMSPNMVQQDSKLGAAKAGTKRTRAHDADDEKPVMKKAKTSTSSARSAGYVGTTWEQIFGRPASLDAPKSEQPQTSNVAGKRARSDEGERVQTQPPRKKARTCPRPTFALPTRGLVYMMRKVYGRVFGGGASPYKPRAGISTNGLKYRDYAVDPGKEPLFNDVLKYYEANDRHPYALSGLWLAEAKEALENSDPDHFDFQIMDRLVRERLEWIERRDAGLLSSAEAADPFSSPSSPSSEASTIEDRTPEPEDESAGPSTSTANMPTSTPATLPPQVTVRPPHASPTEIMDRYNALPHIPLVRTTVTPLAARAMPPPPVPPQKASPTNISTAKDTIGNAMPLEHTQVASLNRVDARPGSPSVLHRVPTLASPFPSPLRPSSPAVGAETSAIAIRRPLQRMNARPEPSSRTNTTAPSAPSTPPRTLAPPFSYPATPQSPIAGGSSAATIEGQKRARRKALVKRMDAMVSTALPSSSTSIISDATAGTSMDAMVSTAPPSSSTPIISDATATTSNVPAINVIEPTPPNSASSSVRDLDAIGAARGKAPERSEADIVMESKRGTQLPTPKSSPSTRPKSSMKSKKGASEGSTSESSRSWEGRLRKKKVRFA